MDAHIGNIVDNLDVLNPITRPLKENLMRKGIELDFFGGILQGFDNNIFLDPSRTRDAFLQTSANGEVKYHFNDDVRFIGDIDVANIFYYRFNDNNLLDISAEPGIEVDFLDDRLTLEADYLIDWIYFPYDESGNYLSNRFSIFARNNVWSDFYHKAGFRLEYKHYTDRKAYGPNTVKKSDLRNDTRYTGEYEAALYLWDRTKIKQVLQLYRNDSNDQFQDYYDYWAFGSRTSLVAFFTDKFYSITSFSYIRKLYDDRLSTDNGAHQKDNLYIFNVTLLYELSSAFTLSAGYSYRENTSNEPLEKYSGSIFTIGLYYDF